MDVKVLYSLLVTGCIVFGTLFITSMIFQVILGEVGIYVAMFASIIFTLVHCTQLILDKLDK